jgi:hypothetical protein
LFGGSLLLRLFISVSLHPGSYGVLLGNQQAADLQELVGLVAGELVGIANGGQLAVCALGGRLQADKLSGVGFQVVLLLLQAPKNRVVGPFLRLGR